MADNPQNLGPQRPLQPTLPHAPQQDPQQDPRTGVPAPISSSTTQEAAPVNSSIEEQARVAAVIYDMSLRGGADAASSIAELAVAYPTAANFARQYAAYAQRALHASRSQQHYAHGFRLQRQHRGDFVLRRISVMSMAWVCFFAGSLAASLRICLIFSLALGAATAKVAENDMLYSLVDEAVAQWLGDGPMREVYRWLLSLLMEENPVVVLGQQTAQSSITMLPSHFSAAVFLTPLTVGVICFLLGAIATMSVNFALRSAGGIRFENHDD